MPINLRAIGDTQPSGSVLTSTPNIGFGQTWSLGTSGPPSGTASGDLSGTYPNPTVARILGCNITALPTTANLVLTSTSPTTAAWQTLPAAPTTLPPTGNAGGDLSGTYPNPTVALVNGLPPFQMQTVRVTATATVTAPLWATVVDITLIAGGGGGGGGSSALTTGGATNQAGGSGGGAGQEARFTIPVVGGSSVPITIGAGGAGGTGGALNSNPGTFGGPGLVSNITIGGTTYVTQGGGYGRNPTANSGTYAAGGVSGVNNANVGSVVAGAVCPGTGGAGPSGSPNTVPALGSVVGGAAGSAATATNGGSGGGAALFIPCGNTGSLPGGNGGAPTATGNNGASAGANTGSGGGGGGGGAPGGAGGNGGNGGSGLCVLTWRSS